MELNNIYEVISQYSSFAVPVVLIIIFFTNRALFLNLIWQKLFKKDYELNDETLGAAVKEQIDLERFRLIFPKLKVRSSYHAKAIIAWCKDYKIGYEEATAQASHLHYNENNDPKISLELPIGLGIDQTMNAAMMISLGIVLCVILFVPSLSGWSDKILVKGKYSDTILWIKNDARLTSTFMADKQWEITANDCKDTTNTKGKMNQKERTALCELVLSEDKMKKFFDKSKRESLATSIVLFIIVIIPWIVFIKSFNRNRALKKLYQYICASQAINSTETTTTDTEKMRTAAPHHSQE